jgi:hypothetical protein
VAEDVPWLHALLWLQGMVKGPGITQCNRKHPFSVSQLQLRPHRQLQKTVVLGKKLIHLLIILHKSSS